VSLLLIGALYGLVFVVCLVLIMAACTAGKRDDEAVARALRERRQERKARSDLYGNGGWRG
jgi:hypothetical protein